MPTLQEVRQAIDVFDLEKARQLLRDHLKNNPSAEAYYLAALAAVSDVQRHDFLEKAIELDPFHKEAVLELEKSKISTKQSLLTQNKSHSEEIMEVKDHITRINHELAHLEKQTKRRPLLLRFDPATRYVMAFIFSLVIWAIAGFAFGYMLIGALNEFTFQAAIQWGGFMFIIFTPLLIIAVWFGGRRFNKLETEVNEKREMLAQYEKRLKDLQS